MRRSAVRAVLGTAALLLAAGSAKAQVAAPVPVPDLTQPTPAPEKVSVAQRTQPEYQPLGLRVGTFIVHPSIALAETLDTNIYGSPSHGKSDLITLITPVIDVASDWNNHALGFYAEGDIKQYNRYSSENVGNVVVQADGRLDILRGEYLELGAGYQLQHEDRDSPDTIEAAQLAGVPQAKYPTEFTVETGHFAYVRSPARIGLELDGSVTAYQFSNEPTTNGSLAINSDRSRVEYVFTPKVSYELSPGYQAFAELSGDRREYDSTFDATPQHYKRSSSGYSLAAGSDFDVGRLITGEAYIGYQDQMYDDGRLGSNSGVVFGGSALWNVTELTSLKLGISRSIGETILIGSSGFWDTEVDGTVEHELLRNLLLTGGVSYIRSEYQGIGRDDDLYGLTAGGSWQLNRNFSLGLSGTWQNRDSNQPGNGFDRELLMINLKVEL